MKIFVPVSAIIKRQHANPVWAIPLLLWSVFWGSGLTHAAPPACDPALSAPEGDPYGYDVRGNRCEGIYVRPVRSTASLVVASLTASLPLYHLAETRKPLVVRWQTPAEAPVRLRATGLARRLYYRMDVRVERKNSFHWPSNVLSGLRLSTSEIGLLGWTNLRLGQVERDIYLPLKIRAEGDDEGAGELQLVLMPRRELKELYVSLALLDNDGEVRAFLRDGEALGYGFYPAGRQVRVPIAGLAGAGFYHLEIGAELMGGAIDALELTFYHGGD